LTGFSDVITFEVNPNPKGIMDVPITAKAALLLALRRGPGFGSELAQRVFDLTGGEGTWDDDKTAKGGVRLRQASLYPGLKKLQEEGLVESNEQHYGKGRENPAETPGGHTRVFWKLTKNGEKAAENYRLMLTKLVRK
jgi:DNA-binding PadR family transcriptional regulator